MIFEEFWALYPRKVAKGAARKAWGRAILKASPLAMIEAIKAQEPFWAAREIQFVPHAATWLNQERWADELEGGIGKPKDGNRHKGTLEGLYRASCSQGREDAAGGDRRDSGKAVSTLPGRRTH